MKQFYVLLSWIGILTNVGYPEDINAVIQTTGAPLTYLLDTHTAASNPLTSEQILEKAGWALVPEDTIQYAFTGDAVFLNDKLALSIRKNGDGAEIYSLMSGKPVLRMALIPHTYSSKSRNKLSSLVIAENSRGAVQLNLTYTLENQSQSFGLRLTTGEVMVEISPGKGTQTLYCRTGAPFVVVPNFFADDMVFTPTGIKGNTLHLPVDQFFLTPIENGNALIMYIWETSHSAASMIVSEEKPEKAFIGSEIECRENRKIWTAFLEKPHIWFLPPTGAKADSIDTLWQPPFSAKWRWNAFQADGWANSSFLPMESKGQGNDALHLIYPIDRDLNTPLTVFCPIDIMKNTLGVGPCQYILESEKLGAASHPTPDQVTDWIEKQFAKKKEKTVKDQLQENLAAMIDYLQQTRIRIQQYENLTSQLMQDCASPSAKSSEISPAVENLKITLEHIKHGIADKRDAMQTIESIRQTADRITALVGRENALSECKSICAQIREIGAAHDYVLSQCRMGMNWFIQQSRMAEEQYPQGSVFFETVRKKADGISLVK